jgi:hypothetical protein
MLVLTVRQPYASLILAGQKLIESRSWRFPLPLPYTIAIHAAAAYGAAEVACSKIASVARAIKAMGATLRTLPRGVILGTVQVVADVDPDTVDMRHSPVTCASSWFDVEHAWLLSSPVLFAQPIPARGKLQLWQHEV